MEAIGPVTVVDEVQRIWRGYGRVLEGMEQFMCCILTFGDVYSALRLPSVAPSEGGVQGSCSEVRHCSTQIEVVESIARRIGTSEQCGWIRSLPASDRKPELCDSSRQKQARLRRIRSLVAHPLHTWVSSYATKYVSKIPPIMLRWIQQW
jgi:hypothetical protein